MEGKQPLLLTLLCNTEKPEKKTWDCIKTPKIKLYGGVYFLKSSTREQDRHDSTTHKGQCPHWSAVSTPVAQTSQAEQ